MEEWGVFLIEPFMPHSNVYAIFMTRILCISILQYAAQLFICLSFIFQRLHHGHIQVINSKPKYKVKHSSLLSAMRWTPHIEDYHAKQPSAHLSRKGGPEHQATIKIWGKKEDYVSFGVSTPPCELHLFTQGDFEETYSKSTTLR